MGTTGFSASFSSTFSSVFSFSMHPVLGAVLAGLGFWPKAERTPPAPAKAQTATPTANSADTPEPPATPDKQAAQKTGAIKVMQTAPPAMQASPQPLRVVRLVEAGMSAANAGQMAGRMVISGRMSDVCAELDRLAA
jgi:hypothetical protein